MYRRSNLLSASICALIAAALLAPGCSKKDTPAPTGSSPTSTPTPIKVTSVSAASANAGDTLTLRGQGLGTDTTKLKLSLNDTLTLRVYQVGDSVASFILPTATRLGYIGSQGFTLDIADSNYTASFPLAIVCPQPHGWFLAYSSPNEFQAFFSIQDVSIAFPSDSIGYAHGDNILIKTRDGGLTWNAPVSSNYGTPYYMGVYDTASLWLGEFSMLTSTDGAQSFQQQNPPVAMDQAFAGMYLSGPATGKVALQNGKIYSINGSFDSTSGITLEFTSSYAGAGYVWNEYSAVDANDAMAVGQVWDPGGVPNTTAPLVTVKTNGTYDEYIMPSAVTTAPLAEVQLVNNALGYAFDTNGTLLKYTGNRNWTALSQKATAFWFAGVDTGYAVYNGAIYQTANGGQNWSSVFTLQPGDVIYNFTGRDGMVWAIGNNTQNNTGIIYKYNP